jgi:3-deoxy-manno-octulosonate cytidylyltransferase (CMP-KDO synthetase)
MKTIGVIPARWASTRFEGKVLADLNGKPMIQHVWERSKQSECLDDLIIACDDQRIVKAAEQFGAKVVLTDANHISGTDRIAEVVELLDGNIIVNIQGDEPLICPAIIDSLVKSLRDDPSCSMGTIIKVINDKKELQDPNIVKVVINGEMNALYFSRSGIPYDREGEGEIIYYKHLGIYAYQREFLLSYKNLPKSNLEKAECLEQLRALEYGYRIKTVITDLDTIGVDTPEDLKKAELLLKSAG